MRYRERLARCIEMLINGIMYYPLSDEMIEASWNRMPCPLCRENIVEFYHTMWANQYGSEHRYFCKCGNWFQVRRGGVGDFYCVVKFKILQSRSSKGLDPHT